MILWTLLILLIIIILLLSLTMFIILKRKNITYDDKKFILFVIDMYLSYGEELNIFPSEKEKSIIISKIEKIKNKLKIEICDD